MEAVNKTGILAAVLALGAFAAAWNVAKNLPVRRRVWLSGLFVVLSLPAVLVAVYYLHVIPEMAWFYEFRSWRGSEFFGIFAGLAGGTLAAFLPRWMLGFPLFGAMAVTVIPYVKPIAAPLPLDLLEDQWKDGVCRQSSASTCGPASVCTILEFLGVESSEREVARAAHSYGGGTEAWYLARFLRSREGSVSVALL